MSKRALICGVTGQDGAYLAKLLIDKGYEVYGASRDIHAANTQNLVRLGISEDVRYESISLKEFRSVLEVLAKVKPDELYNLAGQSSVALSFEQPVETLESISIGTLNILEVIRFLKLDTRFYNACSSECFGDTHGVPAVEDMPFKPRSPYAVAKSTAFWELANYREAYQIHACSGLLFNHESPLRPERFVTKKIIKTVIAISRGLTDKLNLGNLNVKRDWGWAPEYVEAMWRMLQHEQAEDFVIATGKMYSLEQFVEYTFSKFDLDWQQYTSFDNDLKRPTDVSVSVGNPAKAKSLLGWAASIDMYGVIDRMIDAESKVEYFEKS